MNNKVLINIPTMILTIIINMSNTIDPHHIAEIDNFFHKYVNVEDMFYKFFTESKIVFDDNLERKVVYKSLPYTKEKICEMKKYVKDVLIGEIKQTITDKNYEKECFDYIDNMCLKFFKEIDNQYETTFYYNCHYGFCDAYPR